MYKFLVWTCLISWIIFSRGRSDYRTHRSFELRLKEKWYSCVWTCENKLESRSKLYKFLVWTCLISWIMFSRGRSDYRTHRSFELRLKEKWYSRVWTCENKIESRSKLYKFPVWTCLIYHGSFSPVGGILPWEERLSIELEFEANIQGKGIFSQSKLYTFLWVNISVARGGGGQLPPNNADFCRYIWKNLSVHLSRQACHLYRQSIWCTDKILKEIAECKNAKIF